MSGRHTKALPDGIAALLCIAITYCLATLGMFGSIDSFLLGKRFEILTEKIDSNVIIVEIDTKSLQALPAWPWSRAVHADLVNYIDSANPKAISFDVDFSAPSDEAGDQAFANAMAQSNAVVFLAAHRQPLSNELPDIIAEILPNPSLGSGFRLASVNYPIDGDGILRRAIAQSAFSFDTIPSIAVALADKLPKKSPFFVDFSIDTNSFERISYIDVLNRAYQDEFFKDKVVFVGTTASELGDEFVMPVHGMQSGVILNALAYETLHGNRELIRTGHTFTLGITAVVCLLLCAAPVRQNSTRYLTVTIAVLLISIAGPLVLQAYNHISISVAGIHFSQGLCLLYTIGLELEKRSQLTFFARMAEKDTTVLLESLVSDNHEGFIVTNQSGEIELFNERAAVLLGSKHENPTGMQLKELIPNLGSRIDTTETRIGVIDRFQLETHHGKSASLRALDITISRSVVALSKNRFERRTSERIYIVFALHDVTLQKNAEIAERTAKEEFAKTSNAKTKLITNMSHELRTPLNSIIGFSDILQGEQSDVFNPDDYREYASMINQGGRRLLSVINDILYATKLQGNDELEDLIPETPRDLFESAIALSKKNPIWKNQKIIHVSTLSEEQVLVENQSMQHALMHLIDNAAKIGGPDVNIKLSSSLIDGRINLSVEDDGIGCDRSLLPKLTEMFFQGEGEFNRLHEGTGLGLYLVKRVVDLHNGTLTLTSDEGKGFTATIILDCASNAKAIENAA